MISKLDISKIKLVCKEIWEQLFGGLNIWILHVYFTHLLMGAFWIAKTNDQFAIGDPTWVQKPPLQHSLWDP